MGNGPARSLIVPVLAFGIDTTDTLRLLMETNRSTGRDPSPVLAGDPMVISLSDDLQADTVCVSQARRRKHCFPHRPIPPFGMDFSRGGGYSLAEALRLL